MPPILGVVWIFGNITVIWLGWTTERIGLAVFDVLAHIVPTLEGRKAGSLFIVFLNVTGLRVMNVVPVRSSGRLGTGCQ